jgi:hypothetical protein
MRKGKDSFQMKKEWKSIMDVLRVFTDKKEHRYTEIKKASGLNDPTLAKLLSRFTKSKMVKQRWDMSTYPHASYYQATPEFVLFSKSEIDTEEKSEAIASTLSENKDPLEILNWIHVTILRHMLEILRQYKKDKKLEPQLKFLMDILVWQPFRDLTWKLLESTKEIIDEIDIDKIEKTIEKIDLSEE